MDIGKVFPSRYLKVADLDGREITVAIKDVKLENVGQSKDAKPVAYFKGANKGLVLNVTNSKRIAKLAGSDDTDDWHGTKIILYGTETEFAGETVECIRVKGLMTKKEPEPEVVPAKKAKKGKEPDPDMPLPGDHEPARFDVAEVAEVADEDEIPF